MARRISLAGWFFFVAAASGQGIITTIAGTGRIFPPTPLNALSSPLGVVYDVASDSAGNLYIADATNMMVFRVSVSGTLTVVAGNGVAGYSGDGGPATNASLNYPKGVAVDPLGNVYIADEYNHRIRKVSGGMITTVAGDGTASFGGDGGTATFAALDYPNGVALDGAGNLYIADTFNNRIRKVTGGIITTVAGNGNGGYGGDGGAALNAALANPEGVTVDSSGNVFIADTLNHRVRKVTNGNISTIAGTGTEGFSGDGGLATAAKLFAPYGLSVDSSGNVYIADTGNQRIRKVSGAVISTIAGNGSHGYAGDGGAATNAAFYFPCDVALDAAGNIYVADTDGERIRKISGGLITTVAGNGGVGFGGDGGLATNAYFTYPNSAVVDASGNLLIADTGDNRIRKVSNGIVTTVAGTGAPGFSGDGGPATNAWLEGPFSIALDASGNIYIADTNNQRIRRVVGGTITTIAGNGQQGFSGDGGPATSASFSAPQGVAVDGAGNVYVADYSNNRIRKITNGVISTIAGNGNAGFSGDGGPALNAALNAPCSVNVDAAGNLYITDYNNQRIRKVSGGVITTVAGNGLAGYGGDGGLATNASLNFPLGVAVDSAGNLYIADNTNNRIRKVTKGIITTIAGNGNPGFSGDGGPAISASLLYPGGVAVDPSGTVYIVDLDNNRIRAIPTSTFSFQASPTTLSFSATSGGATPASQAVNISSSLPGLAFSVSTSASWLTVSQSNGGAPASLQITADPAQLPAGSANGSVTISAANGVTATVNVTFTVTAALPATLGVSVPNVSFAVTQGASPVGSQVNVLNQGGGSLSYGVTSATATGGNWLGVSPSSGSATPSAAGSFTVTANPAGLAAGTYSGSVVVISPSGSTSQSKLVPVTLAVTGTQQTILLSETGMTFTGAAQGGQPLPQGFAILNTGAGSMSWTASANTLSGGPWLAIDQNNGSVATAFTSVSTVNASVNTAGLAPGTYYGQVQVISPGAANSPQSISVVLNVLVAGTALGAEVQPTGLVFIGSPGISPGSQTIVVSNPQVNPITFGAVFQTVPAGGTNAITLLPVNATVQPNQPVSMVVQPDYTNLTSGVYQGFVELGFLDGSARSVPVVEVVAPGAFTASALQPDAPSGCNSLNVQPTTLNSGTSTVTIGQPVSLQVKVVDNCGNPVTTNSSVQATFNNKDSAVALTSLGNGNWSGTWTPQNQASQVQIIYLAISVTGIGAIDGQAQVTVSVLNSAAPLTAGVGNAASGAGAYIAPGALVSIYGQQFAASSSTSSTLPFPTNVNGTQVTLGGTALPLRYVGNGQINAQVPFNVGINTAQQLVVINGPTLSAPQSVVVAAAQPGVYTQDYSGSGPGIIVDLNTGAEITASHPAHVGDVLVIYCNGLGAVSPALPTGTPAPLNGPVSSTVNPVTVSVGGMNAPVSFAGLVPGYPDLYQVNSVVPSGIATGNSVPVILTVAGQSSPPVTLAVQ